MLVSRTRNFIHLPWNDLSQKAMKTYINLLILKEELLYSFYYWMNFLEKELLFYWESIHFNVAKFGKFTGHLISEFWDFQEMLQY